MEGHKQPRQNKHCAHQREHGDDLNFRIREGARGVPAIKTFDDRVEHGKRCQAYKARNRENSAHNTRLDASTLAKNMQIESWSEENDRA
jgi:hypothetical protein